MKYQNEIIKKKGISKISMLTAYDYSMASILNETELDMILVGDSLGNVIMGLEDTIPVKIEHIVHHAKTVRRGCPDKFLVVDLPFMINIYELDMALRDCALIMQETGANAIKIEGGAHNVALIKKLKLAGIPVMGHLGLTPQSYKTLNGYKKQGVEEASKNQIIEDAKLLEDAGVFAIVLECIPEDLAKNLTQILSIPTIGIGSGVTCDGQVLVINDLLGFTENKIPSFVKPKIFLNTIIKEAVETYINDIR